MRRAVARLLKVLLVTLIPAAAALALYEYVSINEHDAFWNATPGAMMLYGRPPDVRFIRPLARMVSEARNQGFVFSEPQVVQTNNVFSIWNVPWQKISNIAVDESRTRILIYGPGMEEFDDDKLECVLAHELGHIIDYQSNRIGHPVFDRIWCLGDQEFADSIGGLLCGYERYQALIRRHIKHRSLNVTQVCGQRPLQP